MATVLEDGQTIVFIGDSITDCGRREELSAPMGRGYVSFVRDFLAVREPAMHVKVINTGIGGNTIEDLRNRWADDAVSHRPDWLSVMIGINDCHRRLRDAQASELQSPEAFAQIYDELLSQTVKALPDVKLLLIDPFYGSRDNGGQTNGLSHSRILQALARYIATVDRMGAKYKTRRVKTHDVFGAHFEHQHPSVCFPNEPVHPNQTGHMLIAEAVYNALGEDTAA